MMWNYNDWWQMGMGYGFHWIFMVAFWGLLIWGAYALFRWAAPSGGASRRETPLDILKKHYAKGELTRKEFERMREDLA
ncbi:MAG: SHOCT domain-containing protein [SAR324 cluster bacterium]|nr:SHOCT domain-containing protein [SAR324 cluster bacterium]